MGLGFYIYSPNREVGDMLPIALATRRRAEGHQMPHRSSRIEGTPQATSRILLDHLHRDAVVVAVASLIVLIASIVDVVGVIEVENDGYGPASALAFLVESSDGDARRALGALEIGVLSETRRPLVFTLALARESVQRKALVYDAGDTHYDCASALIKSIRGSDPDAGLYWLARMLEGGEDVRFLARRLVILASEDVGNADPRSLLVAVAAMQATEFVGLPECQLPLSQAVTYLALAPQSNACTTAIAAARQDVRDRGVIPVPRHLQDRHSAAAKAFGRGEGYRYAHDHPDGIAAQDYLGVEKRYYEPTDRGEERDLGLRLEEIRRRLAGG